MIGCVPDAIESARPDREAELPDMERLLRDLGHVNWQQAPAVGEGVQRYRS